MKHILTKQVHKVNFYLSKVLMTRAGIEVDYSPNRKEACLFNGEDHAINISLIVDAELLAIPFKNSKVKEEVGA